MHFSLSPPYQIPANGLESCMRNTHLGRVSRTASKAMQRAMSSRAVCTSDGDPSPRYKYIRESGMTKLRRTRKAPDFYSPEAISKTCSSRSKKPLSDDNDSWKPESETDDANSESDSERSNERRDNKTATRRRSLHGKSHTGDDHEDIEMEERQTSSISNDQKQTDEADVVSESDIDDKSSKDKKGETTKHKEKKAKGCRELQDLLDGCVQVHEESRTRRLPPRKEQSRSVQANGMSGGSTWSHGSSRAATEKDSGGQQPDDKQRPQNSSKQPSSLNTSAIREGQKTVDSTTSPSTAEASETVDDAPKSQISTRRMTQDVKRENLPCMRKSKTAADTASENSVRVKRQRIDGDTTRRQTQRPLKLPENGAYSIKPTPRDFHKDDIPTIKLPRMPMIRYGEYWYRARIKQETRETVYVEFTGFEDGMIKPFWIRKDSPEVFKGSYSGKDWRHVGEGAWEPKPRKVPSRKSSTRRNKKRNVTKASESRDRLQASKFSQDLAEQACTGDSEKCSKPSVDLMNSSGERLFYRRSNDDDQMPTVMEENRSVDFTVGERLRGESHRSGDKNMDCGSQSDIRTEDMHSEETFPGVGLPTQQPHAATDSKSDKDDDRNWHKTESRSPNSRNVDGSGSYLTPDDPKKDVKTLTVENRKDSSSIGNEISKECAPTRQRRKSGRVPIVRQEEDRTVPLRNAPPLRRSQRLVGPKETWRFKEESSSEADFDDDCLTAPPTRRNGATRGIRVTKYVTRSMRNPPLGRRPSGTLSSQTLHRTTTQKPHRSIYIQSKKGRKRIDSAKDEITGDDYEELIGGAEIVNPPSPNAFHDSQLTHLEKERCTPIVDKIDGKILWNVGVNVLSEIRKYLPYYTEHIPDDRLYAFVELMERMEGIGQSPEMATQELPDAHQLTRPTAPASQILLPMGKPTTLATVSEVPGMEDEKRPRL